MLAGSTGPAAPRPAAAPQPFDAHVVLDGVSKSFGSVCVLRDVAVAFERGAAHALVGENGAGKSTLGKIVAGIHAPDGGRVTIDGERVSMRSPLDALKHGITAVAQEISLVPARSVLANVYLGIEPRRHGLVDVRALRRRFAALCEEVGFDLPQDAPVRSLRLADQYKVELLRAIARQARLIVLDEPTAALTAQDSRTLVDVVLSLRARGTTIVYVSHDLDEVLEISDRVTVLRDGALIETLDAAGATPAALVTKMLGRSLDVTFPEPSPPAADAPLVYRVAGLRTSAVHDVDLEIRAGEIVGLAGLVGSGRTEIARAVFGADPRLAGRTWLDGEEVVLDSPSKAIGAGLAMVPESRKTQGLVLCRSVADNIVLPYLKQLRSARGTLDRRRAGASTAALMEALDVQPRAPGALAARLSGGNQQKVMFARWLMRTPRLLIVDEPTRGIDVGAKRGIYELLHRLSAQGMAILLISSEMEEVLGLSHRVLVMRAGRVAAHLAGEAISEGAVTRAAFGVEVES